MPRIHVFGASGSGSTTLGEALAQRLCLPHADADHFFWLPTDPPFTMRRPRSERLAMLTQALPADGHWVFSGSAISWATALEPAYDLIVFLHLDPTVRMQRLYRRETARYGARIEPGGDMAMASATFFQWAAAYDTAGLAQRSLAAHEAWLGWQTAQVLRLDAAMSVDALVGAVEALQGRKPRRFLDPHDWTATTRRSNCTTMDRIASITRTTTETDISITLNLDGAGRADIATGIGFLDHMLTALTRHGLFDLTLRATGDLHIDFHHTTEDVGIVLGQAFRKAIGDKRGISRFGHALIPMDETLAEAAVDISGRPFLVWNVAFARPKIGEMDTELFEEFFRALAFNAMVTLHINQRAGHNAHHVAEACFKAAARALRAACALDPRAEGAIPSTKGSL